MAIIAVARDRAVGVDVENCDRAVDIETIAKSVFAPEEMNELLALHTDERRIAFFDCWTRKEAFVKALGVGLQRSLDSFAVSLRPREPAALRITRPDSTEKDQWTLYNLELGSGYAGALALSGGRLPLLCRTLNFM